MNFNKMNTYIYVIITQSKNRTFLQYQITLVPFLSFSPKVITIPIFNTIDQFCIFWNFI